MRRSVFRIAKDLFGLRRNGVSDCPISVALPSLLPTVRRGSILRRFDCQKSVDYDSGSAQLDRDFDTLANANPVCQRH
jgi:hypothetical protein